MWGEKPWPRLGKLKKLKVLCPLACKWLLINKASDKGVCADQVKFQISDWLEEGKKVVSVQKDLEMTGHTLYEVQVALDLDGNMIGIPYRAVYKVLTENGPQGTCALIDSKLVSEVH